MEIFKKRALFWDVEADQIDPWKNKQFILERILNFGDEKDFRWSFGFYGEEAFKKAILASRTLAGKSLSFWCQIFKLDQIKCLSQPSTLKQDKF